MWNDPGWFIYQLEVRIRLESSAEQPPTFLYLSFFTLYSSYFGKTNTILVSKF